MNCTNCNKKLLYNAAIRNKFDKLYTRLTNDINKDLLCNVCLNHGISELTAELSTKLEVTIIKTDFIEYRGLNKNEFPEGPDGVYTIEPNEYEFVANKFHNKDLIVFIEKNKNLSLINRYIAARNTIKDFSEKLLFHGSANNNFDSIIKDGFLLSKAQHGLLGRGIYGAVSSTYSISYAGNITAEIDSTAKNYIKNVNGSNQKFKVLMLCDFIICKNRYETMSAGNGEIYAVPAEEYVYPKYIIYCKASEI